ncbi:MAG: hypothetical protein WCL60_16345 [Methylococcales bacterium]
MNRLSRYFYVQLIVLVMLSTSGCVNLPPSTNLKSAEHAVNILPKTIWVDEVKVTDANVKNQKVNEQSLRGNITNYIQEGGYFKDANALPGIIGKDDLVLDFEFDHFIQERHLHPLSLPLSIGTLGLYMLFGGPIAVDESNLSGHLIVKDSNSKTLTRVSAEIQEDHYVSLYNSMPIGLEARTSLVNELLTKCVNELKNNNYKH